MDIQQIALKLEGYKSYSRRNTLPKFYTASYHELFCESCYHEFVEDPDKLFHKKDYLHILSKITLPTVCKICATKLFIEEAAADCLMCLCIYQTRQHEFEGNISHIEASIE